MDNGAGYDVTGPCACPQIDESMAKHNVTRRDRHLCLSFDRRINGTKYNVTRRDRPPCLSFDRRIASEVQRHP